MKARLAWIISRILDLYTWSIIINVLFLINTGLNRLQITYFSLAFLLLEVILPFLLYYFFRKRKLITDVDLSLRRQRPLYFFCLFLLVALGTLMGMVFGTREFFLMQLTSLFLVGATTAITLFWKISGHAMVTAAGVLFINYFFAWRFWWLFFILIPVCWSRWYLHKHTPLQLLAGAILGTFLPMIILRLVGLF